MRLMPGTNPVHFQRLIRRKMGATIKDIAHADRISERAVAESVNAAEIYLNLHSLEYVNASVGSIVSEVRNEAKLALKNGLTAKKKEKDKKSGRVVTKNDLPMQMRALSEMTGMVEAIQPKAGKGVVVNANAAANAAAGATTFSEENYQPGFEEIIDTIRAKVERQNLVPREVSTTTDDVILEGELEDSAEETDSRDEDDEPDDSAERSP